MKSFYRLLVTLFVALVLSCNLASAQEITLRAADVQPEGYPTVLGLEAMATYLETKTAGRIQMEVFPGGQLGDERSIIEQVQLGVLEIARVNTSPVGEFYSPMGVFSLPYIFRNQDHYVKVLQGPIGTEMLAGLEEVDLVGLAYYDSGSRSFYSREPIRSVEDLQGLRVRTMQSQVVLDMMDVLGAEPVPMAFGEVYSSLQTGVVDAAENNYPSYGPDGVRHFEVAPYFTEDGHSRIPEIVLMAKSTWDKLSPEDQQTVREASAVGTYVQFQAWADLAGRAKQDVIDRGVEVFEVDTMAFQEAVQPLYDKYGVVYADLLASILETE